ncbi:hypothetical protein [Candidatus Lucifugimonas marina]|uniref:Uncharacterized protein n=3 Tax=Candidatus Lucifugimonas marina TaxID=3038979 RepID=A0AAJ6CRI8_9CHLR|nr:hypothetical protein [SAR202 cluster bacterium JH702]MDG0869798.1 hypothetical protein [SAR202 cluster bacterium JH639]WFG38453.1 hypothetical protein GKO48_02140 [SAR202 cluster bacterium JH1073]
MVTSVNPSAQVRAAQFSFAQDSLGQPQPVNAVIGGFDYPGEVIVADAWEPEFGEQLNSVNMFRLVLLQTSGRTAPTGILDKRILVAVQSNSPAKPNRIGESRSSYVIDSNPNETRRNAEAEIKSIREVRANYAAASDPALDRLTSALEEYESKVNESFAEDAHELWKQGEIITSSESNSLAPTANQIFLLDTPESWVEVAAASIYGPANFHSADSVVETIFSDLQIGHVKTAKDHLRQMCGIHLGDATPLDLIESMIADRSREILGDELRNLLIHDLSYPPALASLWLASYIVGTDSEIELITESGERNFVSTDNISELSIADIQISSVNFLRREKSSDWDALLPFLQLIMPHANSTRYGGGRNSDAEEFNLQLSTVSERVNSTTPVMQALEIAAGATDRPLTAKDKDLSVVLGSFSWLEFSAQARNVFGSVKALRSALSGAALRWSAVDSAPEIERAIIFLDQVEFGRFDHALSVEKQLLRSRFDLKSIVESPTQWLSLRDEFERWRQDYRRAYLEDHAQKQERNRQLHQQITATTRLVAQIEQFEQIDAIRLGSEIIGELSDLWSQTIRSCTVCEHDGASISLIDEPVCSGCRGRLGQPPNHTDVADMIAEIDSLFTEYRDRLATVTSKLVMKSQNPDKLNNLFRLNSAGDLSDLANVLDDKVISFLNELFSESGNTGGNSGDWASPHS